MLGPIPLQSHSNPTRTYSTKLPKGVCLVDEAASEGSTSLTAVGGRGGGAYHLQMLLFLQGGEAFPPHQLLLKLLKLLLGAEEGAFHPQQMVPIQLQEEEEEA